MEDKEKKDKISLEQEIHEFIKKTLKPLKEFDGRNPADLAELKSLLEISLEKINTKIQVLRSKDINIEIKKPDLRLKIKEDEYGFDC